jgi:oligogalacturonide lyase
MGDSGWTRRRFLPSLAAGVALGAPARVRSFPSERTRYADPSTEFTILRLTSPQHSSFLPAPYQRAVSQKRSFLLYVNDRLGSPQLFQMNLSSGESRQLSSASNLDSDSATLSPDDRSVFFFDGPSLRQLTLGTMREREVYRVRDGWQRTPGFSLSRNGEVAVLVEANGTAWQLRMIPLTGREPQPVTVSESAAPLDVPLVRPRHEEVLCREGARALTLASLDGRGRNSLSIAPGRLGPAFWAADGERVVYLNFPEAGLNSIRECLPDTGTERLVAATSQFASFSPNADASVFTGASANKASPHVLLLLRVARRELTLCEHRASDPTRVAPIFSPDSQRVYFQSDRDGKPAIYTVSVERLVERTGE